MRWAIAVVSVVLFLAGCTAGGRPRPAPAPPAATFGGGAEPAGGCTVSRPNAYEPRPPSPAVRFVNGEFIPGNSNAYGNADLWAGLPVNGELVTHRTRDGYVATVGWWLVHPGHLTVTAAALDRPEPGFTGQVRKTGYSGRNGFRASRLVFPAYGCWRITGRMRGRAPLTFTVRVADPAGPAPSPTGSRSDDEWHVNVG